MSKFTMEQAVDYIQEFNKDPMVVFLVTEMYNILQYCIDDIEGMEKLDYDADQAIEYLTRELETIDKYSWCPPKMI